MHKRHSLNSGFTIVELLIVIVVIAILATISIVAYRNLQERARAADVSSALTQAKKKLELYKVDNGTYPLSGSLASAGVTSSDGSFQYTSDGSTFCLTATSDTVSYTATNTTSPTQGGCAGHGQGGVVAVTNIVPNPNFEASTTGWGGLNLSSPSIVRDTTTAFAGNSSIRFQHSGNGSDGYLQQSTRSTVTPGAVYAGSFSVRKSGTPSTVTPYIIFFNSSSSVIGTPTGPSQSVAPSTTWTRFTVTATAPANAATASIWVGVSQPPISDTFYADGFILTQGSTHHSFADGNSPNWIWNGTPNNSTSTGPAL